jgi:hypothetical protein
MNPFNKNGSAARPVLSFRRRGRAATRLFVFGALIAIVAAVVLAMDFRAKEPVVTGYRHRGLVKYCRVRFGSPNPQEIVLGWTSDYMLLFRSGKVNSVPERYKLELNELSDETAIPPITGSDGTKYTITSAYEHTGNLQGRAALLLDVTIERDSRELYQYADVALTRNLAKLSEARFDAPMSILPVMKFWKELPKGFQLVLGGEPTRLLAHVGTMDEQAGCWTVLESEDRNFPDGRHFPTLTIEFPAKDSANPIEQTYVMNEHC